MKTKNTIVIINHYGITPDMPGATKHYALARYFAAKNEYNIEFWMCGYNHVTGEYVEELKGFHIQHKYRENGIGIVKIKSIPDWGGLLMRQLNIMMFDFITGIKILFSKKIKCIILSMPPITFFATDAAFIKKIKIVADVEDLWPLFMEDMGMENKLASTYMEYFANHTYNLADAFEAVSIGMLNYVKNKISNKNKKSWLSPLGVDMELFDSKLDRSKIEKYQWKDDFIIVYAGAHGRANDLESVLYTIRHFNKKYRFIKNKKISFVFIGDGDNKDSIVNLARELGLHNVHFEDAVPSYEIPQILMNVDVCLTNLKKIESFKLVRPNKLFQYMAAKKPVICGIWGEAAEIIENASAGIYIDFTIPYKAANILYEFIEHEDLTKLGNNGFEYVMREGNRKIIFEKFYRNIKDIIE